MNILLALAIALDIVLVIIGIGTVIDFVFILIEERAARIEAEETL